jgi:hypothetical protein
MASLQETVTVSVKVETTVPRPIAEHIAAEFLEWLDTQGLTLANNPAIAGNRDDDRSYKDLAHEFLEEWS